MLIELFRVLIRFFRVISLLLPPNPFRPPDAIVEMFSAAAGGKALPANSDVEYANYKMFSAVCQRAKESLQKAVNADETRKNKKGVILLYQSAIKDILAALAIRACSCPANKYTEISEQHQILSRYLESAQERIMKLEGIAQQPAAATTTDFGFSRAASSNSNVCVSNRREPLTKAKILNGVSSKHGDEIFSTIISYSATDTKLTMNDVKGNIAAKAALEESVVLPALNPRLFTGLRAPCKGILLFGPPGNGKTMIAKAVANECQSTFFNISAATIMSKWVGEGERLVQALFQAARNAQPSIIFIDEVDSMLCERSENENGAARRVKTEFLIQLDGCAGKSDDRVLVLAATNRPYELDEGILRRFPMRIFIDLPDQRAREEMIRRTFEKSNTRVSLSRKDIDVVASKTAGYSYSDLNELCRCAALIPLRSMDRSTLSKLRAEELRPVCFQDMERAWQTVKPSTNMENRQKLLEFARKYAQISE